MTSGGARRLAVLLAALASGCGTPPAVNPNILVVGITSGPDNLDPRLATDDASEKADQLMFNGLMAFDASLLDPATASPLRGAYRYLDAVEARDRYTVVFTLAEPFASFPVSLLQPGIVPDGAGAAFRDHPIGTGPYRFVRYATDDRLELARFDDYFGGRPENDGLVLRVVPDTVMRSLELRTGSMDIVVNDLEPDLVFQLEQSPRLQVVRSAGTDYQYVGVNVQDPVLRDARVRQALALAIDRQAIVTYLRRGLATPADGMLPPASWAFDPHLPTFPHSPERAKALLDAAGHPDGDGPAPRFHLTLKVSSVEQNRLQSAVVQENLREVGIALDVRTSEFATLFADVLKGRFQLYFLQRTGGSVADPDILRRVFHSNQVPPDGFNRGHFRDDEVDRLLDEASTTADADGRRRLFNRVQERLAEQVPCISLWHKTNAVVAQRSLTGIHVLPTADFTFLKDVARR